MNYDRNEQKKTWEFSRVKRTGDRGFVLPDRLDKEGSWSLVISRLSNTGREEPRFGHGTS